MTCYMRHIRVCKICSNGARGFFKTHDLDWNDFLKNGIDAEKFIETKDAMAFQVVEAAENEQ